MLLEVNLVSIALRANISVMQRLRPYTMIKNQTVFTFSDVGTRLPAESKYVGGISARVYVRKIADKKFQISGVLFNVRKAWVWDLNDPEQRQ